MKRILYLQLVVIIYTLSGVAAKYASNYAFLSTGFILCYALEILILVVYAFLWQQMIKRVDLSVAYANRSISLFWSMLWAALLFNESISLTNILGVILVVSGTLIVSTGEN